MKKGGREEEWEREREKKNVIREQQDYFYWCHGFIKAWEIIETPGADIKLGFFPSSESKSSWQ